MAVLMNSGFIYVILKSKSLRNKSIFIFMTCIGFLDVMFCTALLFLLTFNSEWKLGLICCRIIRLLFEFGADTKPILMVLVTFVYIFKVSLNRLTVQMIIGISVMLGLCEILPLNSKYNIVQVEMSNNVTMCLAIGEDLFKVILTIEMLLKLVFPFCAVIMVFAMFTFDNLHKKIRNSFETKIFATVLTLYVILSSPLIIFAYLRATISQLIQPDLEDVDAIPLSHYIYNATRLTVEFLSMLGPLYKPVFFYFKFNEVRNEVDLRVKSLFYQNLQRREPLIENVM